VWKSLLRTALQEESELADELFGAKLVTADADRYWQDGIELLTKIETAKSKRLFRRIIVEEVQRGSELSIKRLGVEPVRSLIQHQFWVFAESVDSKARIRLFEIIRTRMRSVDVAQLLRSGFSDSYVSEKLGSWMGEQLVPYALESETLDTDFGKSIADSEVKKALAERLATKTLSDWQYLKAFPDTWKSQRRDEKDQLLARIRAGVQAAFLNTSNSPSLNAGILRLPPLLDNWAHQESPVLDSELNIPSSLEISPALPEQKEALEQFFHQQPRHPHDLTLFLGANPWAFKYLFSSSGNWPNKDVLLESICKSFVFVAKLRLRAEKNARNIKNSVVLDLGIAIRGILADIETDIAGYFIFRDVIESIGMIPVAPRLGTAVTEADLFTEKYKVLRESGGLGLLRVFSHGLKIGNRVIDSPTVTQSGVEDDRD
jgi:hypothetical protein